MTLLRKYLDEKINELLKQNISIKMIGERRKIPKDILIKINECENLTKRKKGLNLILALNYGSRNEIVSTFNKLLNKYKKKKIKITEKDIAKNLYTKTIPDPDLLIRTGGFKRLSNFLLLYMNYTEFHFTKTLWPDLTNDELDKIINEYKTIKRNYGL